MSVRPTISTLNACHRTARGKCSSRSGQTQPRDCGPANDKVPEGRCRLLANNPDKALSTPPSCHAIPAAPTHRAAPHHSPLVHSFAEFAPFCGGPKFHNPHSKHCPGTSYPPKTKYAKLCTNPDTFRHRRHQEIRPAASIPDVDATFPSPPAPTTEPHTPTASRRIGPSRRRPVHVVDFSPSGVVKYSGDMALAR
jgi:hypothetical protein